MNRKIMISLRIVPWILLLSCPGKAISQSIPSKPALIIFDSDMGPDYDDVGAIAILHALADSGQAKILATIASTRYEPVAGVLNVFNTYFKRPDIPIGTPKGHGLELRDKQHWTDSLLAHYPHHYLKNDDAADAVALYRKHTFPPAFAFGHHRYSGFSHKPGRPAQVRTRSIFAP